MKRALRLLAGGVRYCLATRSLWESYAQALRYFRCAHGTTRWDNRAFAIKVRDLSLITRPKDWCAFDEVLCRDEYRFIDVILSPCARPTVLDVGANIGLFAARVLRAHPRAVVVSLEASPSTFDVLRRNCSLNPRRRWRALHGALWNHDGAVSFEEFRYSTAGRVSDTGSIRVPAYTLARLLREQVHAPVSLLKMDIEGAEETALASQEPALARVGCVVVEIHPERCSLGEVVSLLRRQFRYLYAAPDRHSTKPLVVATRQPLELPLFAA